MKLSDLQLDLRLPKQPPIWLVSALSIGPFLAMTVGAAIWYKRSKFTPEPRYHIFHDMDDQAKFKAQSDSAVYDNGSAMQLPVPGTVAWGRSASASVGPDPDMLRDDDLSYRGFEVNPETGETRTNTVDDKAVPVYLGGYPEIVSVNNRFEARGLVQFDTFCAVCHGFNGKGDGAVHRRATALANTQGNPSGTVWTAPADLTLSKFTEAEGYTNGRVFNTISQGQGNMPGHASQISVEDRWAIVAYLRALQLSQGAEMASPAEDDGSVPHDHDGDGVADH